MGKDVLGTSVVPFRASVVRVGCRVESAGGPPGLPIVALSLVVALAGCVAVQPATDTANPASPSLSTSTPTPTTSTAPLAYTPDIAPIFVSDCVPCHAGSRPQGNYSMANYAAVMRDVSPGNANSVLVTKTQSGGSMYRYFSVDRAGRADMVRRWVVNYQAAASR